MRSALACRDSSDQLKLPAGMTCWGHTSLFEEKSESTALLDLTDAGQTPGQRPLKQGQGCLVLQGELEGAYDTVEDAEAAAEQKRMVAMGTLKSSSYSAKGLDNRAYDR